MRKNDRFPLTIEDMSVNGEGIGHYEGMTFFVKGALTSDIICAQATKLKKNYGYARAVEILTPSPDRVKPPCPVARTCGGCSLQALAYPKQLELKAAQVRNALIRIGGFDTEYVDSVTAPITGMENPLRYRNKAQYPVGRGADGLPVTGFYAPRSHRIVPNEDCLLGSPFNARILRIVRSYMTAHDVPAYDEEMGKGLIRHVLIREGFHTGEIMVCIVANGTRLPYVSDLTEALTDVEGMTSIVLNVNTKRTNVILGTGTDVLWGRPFIYDEIGGVKFEISANSFYQVNPVQTEKLYGKALEYADLSGSETVWDLYCGIGTISLFMAQRAGQVYGVEVVPDAVADARRNAALNGLNNVRFFEGRAEEVLPRFYSRSASDTEASHPDVIVVDPPRKGCDEKCLQTMTLMDPSRIVYVSCNPATLARDLRFLCDRGYKLTAVSPFDQFPMTMHVETCVLLERMKRRPDAYVK